MKIVFNTHAPLMLAHGGAEIQLERTQAGLQELGVAVEPLRWWDRSQGADVLHQFGSMPASLIRAAHVKGWKVANTLLFTQTCNRSPGELLFRKLCVQSALRAPLPGALRAMMPWRNYHLCDRIVVGIEAERTLLENVYGLKPTQVSVVPLGLSNVFLKATPASRKSNHLIYTGRIHPSKGSLELARLAHETKAPVLFVGKPLEPESNYWQQFKSLVDGVCVKLQDHVDSEQSMVELLQNARGYVLLSHYENWCLSAHEAAACGLPLLVPDQPWSRERFGDQAHYFPRGKRGAAAALRQFYEECPQLPAPKIRFYSWLEVAGILRGVYAGMLNGH